LAGAFLVPGRDVGASSSAPVFSSAIAPSCPLAGDAATRKSLIANPA
jgi:hypothetical protein